MEKKNGPSKVVIPAQEYWSCEGCKHLAVEPIQVEGMGISMYLDVCKLADKVISTNKTRVCPKWCPLQIKSYDNEPETTVQ